MPPAARRLSITQATLSSTLMRGVLPQASTYLNKLPQQLSAEDLIIIADPMLATGERFEPHAW